MQVESHSGQSHLGSRLSRGVRRRLFGSFVVVVRRISAFTLVPPHGSSPVPMENEILAHPVFASHLGRIDWFHDSLRRVDDGRRPKEPSGTSLRTWQVRE